VELRAREKRRLAGSERFSVGGLWMRSECVVLELWTKDKPALLWIV
jgi:hypothetical protein